MSLLNKLKEIDCFGGQPIAIFRKRKESILAGIFLNKTSFCVEFLLARKLTMNDKFALYYLLSACNLIVLSEQLSAVCGRLEIDCFDSCVSAKNAVCRRC